MSPQPGTAFATRRDLFRGAGWLLTGLLLAPCLVKGWEHNLALLAQYEGASGPPPELKTPLLPLFAPWFIGALLLFMAVEGGLRLRRRLLLHGWQMAARCCLAGVWLLSLLLLLLLPCVFVHGFAEGGVAGKGAWCSFFWFHALEALTIWLAVAGTALLLAFTRLRRPAEVVTDIQVAACHSLPGLVWEAFLLVFAAPLALVVLACGLCAFACYGMLEWLLVMLTFLFPGDAPTLYEMGLMQTAWFSLAVATLAGAPFLVMLYQWRRCFGWRWLRCCLSVVVGLVAVAALLLAVVAGVRAVQLFVDPQGAEGWALAFLPAVALHFILLGVTLPLLWCRRVRAPKESDPQP